MDNNFGLNRVWSLEYTFVCAISLLLAGRKIYIDPSMTWTEVLMPFVFYYVMIAVLGIIKATVDAFIEYLSKKE